MNSTSGLNSEINNTGRYFAPGSMIPHEWSHIIFAFVMICSSLGTSANVALAVGYRNRVGNIFLSCTGYTDLLMTAAVMPLSAALLLKGGDTAGICYLMQFLAESCFYSYSLFFAFLAIGEYFRIKKSMVLFNSTLQTMIILAVLVVSTAIAGNGVGFNLDYDYCERRHHGNLRYRTITACLFQLIPAFLSGPLLYSTIVYLRRWCSGSTYNRCHHYTLDYITCTLNLTAFLYYVVSWCPCLIFVYISPDASDLVFYVVISLGFSRSALNSFFYITADEIMQKSIRPDDYRCTCDDFPSYSLRTSRGAQNRTIRRDSSTRQETEF